MTDADTSPVLVDTNVLVYSTEPRTAFHEAARRALGALYDAGTPPPAAEWIRFGLDRPWTMGGRRVYASRAPGGGIARRLVEATSASFT